MPYNGLHEFVELLESKGQLIRIRQFVNPELEITEIVDRVSKSIHQNKALLFENTGTGFPLLINACGSEERISLALNQPLSSIENEIRDTIDEFLVPPSGFRQKINTLLRLKKISSFFPYVSKSKATCQEVICKEPDLSILPVLKCWPYDGGKFITLPVVNTKDPVTGARNAGMYRMQVFGPKETGMHWHIHKTGARHFEEYLKQKKRIPVAVVLGGDPVYAYCASAPLPDGIDEYILAGYLRKKRVKLVKCLTQDVEVPADADIVIEGYVDPLESLVKEGPFGDHTGFYSLPDQYPLFHITCITHRKNAIYPATIVGVPPQEDFWFIKASERIFLPLLQKAGLPDVVDMCMPDYGVAHNLVVVQIKNGFPGQVQKVAHSLWGMGQMMLNKVLVITDFNPHDEVLLFEKMIHTGNLPERLFFSTGPMDALEHASDVFAFGGKVSIDLTNIDKVFLDNVFNNRLTTDVLNVCKRFQQIREINMFLLKKGWLHMTLSGSEKLDVGKLMKSLTEFSVFPGIILLSDSGLEINNINMVLWNGLANIDPVRDIKIHSENSHKTIVINCMSKPGINKNWPNPVYSSNETIQKIDSIWTSLGFSEFEKSPSLKIYNLIVNEGYKI